MSNGEQSVKEMVHTLPQNSGVYFMKNKSGVIIYIGKAKSLKSRVSSYFVKQKDRPNRLKHLIRQIKQIDYMVTETEVEAFLLEASLIKKHRPKYNIRLKDDKTYPYIKLSLSEDYPRLNLSRRVTSKKDLYYGPFTSSHLVRENIKFLNGIYMLRDCSNGFMKARKRPCLTYEIKRCTAPCVNFVDKKEYKSQVQKAVDFLEGRTGTVLDDLEEKMKKSANQEDFEKAAEYRNHLKAAKFILEKQKVVSFEVLDRDFISFLSHEKGTVVAMVYFRKGRLIGERTYFLSPLQSGVEENFREKALSFLNQYYLDNFIPDEVLMDLDLGRDLSRLFMDLLKERRGFTSTLRHTYSGDLKDIMNKASKLAQAKLEDYIFQSSKKEKGLLEIQKKFDLNEYPIRMECYDISNFQGGQSVGSQIVFYEGSPSIEDYRIYKVKTVIGSDDFQSIKEVLSRRLAHNEYQDPQLIVIDGGKGQLTKAIEALKELGREDLKVVGLAKSREKGSFDDQDLKRTTERFFIPGRSNPLTFKHHSEALKILTFMRDEAHRFAITHHRRIRERGSLNGAFEGLKGLGPVGFKRLKDFLSKSSDWSTIDEESLKKNVKLNKAVRGQVLFVLHGLIKESKDK